MGHFRYIDRARESLNFSTGEEPLAISRVEAHRGSPRLGDLVLTATANPLAALLTIGSEVRQQLRERNEPEPLTEVKLDFSNSALLVLTNQRLVVAKATVRASKTSLIANWRLDQVATIGASVSRSAGGFQVIFVDGTRTGLTRMDGSKMNDWCEGFRQLRVDLQEF